MSQGKDTKSATSQQAKGGSITVAQKKKMLESQLPADYSVRERIEKLEHIRILVSKYSAMKEKESQLKRFLVEADGTQECMVFFSGDEEKFRLTNTSIQRKIIQLIQSEMKNYREGIENDILTFTFEGE